MTPTPNDSACDDCDSTFATLLEAQLAEAKRIIAELLWVWENWDLGHGWLGHQRSNEWFDRRDAVLASARAALATPQPATEVPK